MITTCSTFAVYSAKFTASAAKGVAVADDPDGDPEMEKRWDFLYKFEKNFNHWYVMCRRFPLRSVFGPITWFLTIPTCVCVGSVNTSIVCSITLQAITGLYCHW